MIENAIEYILSTIVLKVLEMAISAGVERILKYIMAKPKQRKKPRKKRNRKRK